MVHRTGLDDHLQRHHGVRVRIFLGEDAVDSSVAEEDLGRIHRWRILDCRFWSYSKFKYFVHILLLLLNR